MALLVGVVIAASAKDRYAEMTEEEFQGRPCCAAVLGLHKFLQPKRVEYILKKDKHVEADSTDSGDRPPEDPRAKPKK